MLRRYRILSQIAFFALFCLIFFFINRYPRAYHFPSDIFLRLNPLTALLVSAASRTVIVPLLFTGLAVGVLTVLFGRFFCGFVCPLGALVDLSDTIFFKKARSEKRRPPRFAQRIKYVALLGLAVLSLFGAIVPLFMDPVSLLTRIFTIVFYPLINFAGNEALAAGGPLLDAVGLENIRMVSVMVPVFYGIPFAALLLFLVLGGGFWDRRFWCQYFCPSGAFFGFLSRFPLFRRIKLQSGCAVCASCETLCPTRAIIPPDGARTNTAECIVCGLCSRKKNGCSGFGIRPPQKQSIAIPDLQRRHLLFGVAGGALLLPIFKSTAIDKSDGRGTLIRPPGAIPEKVFLSRCIACGNCMKACPTNALQPCMPGDGFVRLYTPKLVPRIGGCDSKCRLCGYSCPTGALRRISAEEKPYIKLGTAIIDRHRCIAWAQNKECLVCDEVCPYNAIEPRLVQTTKGPFKVPVVREDLCMGCGLCEKECPVFDRAAIEIYRFGENRQSAGPYASDSQKRRIDELRKMSDKDLISGHTSGEEANSSAGAAALPPGFE